MQTGNTYSLNTNGIAKTNPDWTFTFDVKKLRSEAIHVNQVGYSPDATEKFGYVYHWMGNKGGLSLTAFAGKPFYLVNLKTSEIDYSGLLTFRKGKNNAETGQANDTPDRNFLGADVYECNFSSFNQSGDYKLVVEGIGSSFPFRIRKDVYRDVYYTAIRGLYHNRSGIELKQPFTEFVRKAPHNPFFTPGFADKLKYSSSRFTDWKNGDHDAADKPAIETGIKGPINVWGWYQDAGDWDSYYTHLNIPAMLMFAWQFTPENYTDGELNIPEGKNGIPDILDEASWLLRCFYRIRQEIMKKGYGTGGIGTRICGDHFGADAPNDIGRGSWQDNDRTWIVSGEDPHSTYKYAALAAQFAWCLKTLNISDPEGIDWEKEAKEAFGWAKANTHAGDESAKPAMSHSLRDIRGFAASCLYQLSGENVYHEQLKTDLAGISETGTLSDESRFGPLIYASITTRLIDNTLKSKCISAIKNTANEQVTSAGNRACRWGGNWWFPMLVGHQTTPMVFEVMMGWFVTKDSDPSLAKNYKTCIRNTADYFLGNNPLNIVWMTGIGQRRPERVFHLDSWYSEVSEMVPGITPYGAYKTDASAISPGPWDAAWANKTLFPASINGWPGHERWFNQYTCPITAEFTVHQNTVVNASVYGFLCEKPDGSFSANLRPRVDNAQVKKVNNELDTDKLIIQTEVSDPDTDSRIYKVEFYDGWHKIGEDFETPYQLEWSCSGTYSFDLWVKVYDELGAYSKSVSLKRVNLITAVAQSIKKEMNVKAFPNPGSNCIKFAIEGIEKEKSRMQIFNASGRMVKQFYRNELDTKSQFLIWNPKEENCSPGIYLYYVDVPEKPENGFITGKFVFLD
jgi:hypothetical protein